MLLDAWDLSGITVDLILWAQGADPEVIRSRRPQLVKFAERAMAEVDVFVKPVLVYHEVAAPVLSEDDLVFEDRFSWGGLAPHCFLNADTVVLMVGTIGADLEAKVSALMHVEPAYALAVDALGTVALDVLERAALNYVKVSAAAQGLRVTKPFSPGIAGWPLAEGQQQIFALLDPVEVQAIGLTLLPSAQLHPKKSFSLALGVGQDVQEDGHLHFCDTCALRATCAYQGRHLMA